MSDHCNWGNRCDWPRGLAESTPWIHHGIILICSHFDRNFVTDSWDFHMENQNQPWLHPSLMQGSHYVALRKLVRFFATSKVRLCSDVFCPVPKHKTCAVFGDFKSWTHFFYTYTDIFYVRIYSIAFTFRNKCSKDSSVLNPASCP